MGPITRWLRTQLWSGGRRRRISAACVVALAAAFGVFMITNALAVHDEGVFQLDGNAFNTAGSTPAMPTAAEDADNICAVHLKIESTNPADEFCHPASAELTTYLSGLKTKSSRSAFVTDGSGAFASGENDDQWTSGSKDDQAISEWKYKQAASSNDKSDIENAFASVYTASNNHKIIYFGGDRISNSGSENTAFWFLEKTVTEKPNTSGGCTISSGCPFSGEHTAAEPGKDNCLTPQGKTIGINMSTGASCTESDNGAGNASTDQGGDVLVVSAFSIGGTQPTTTAYEWVGVGKAPKSRCVTSKCSVIEISEEKPGCDPLEENDPVCAITNQNIQYTTCPTGSPRPQCVAGNAEPIPSPWIFTEKSSDTATSGAGKCTVASNSMCPGIYFEGGLDLTALGLGEECTAAFTMDTRSSASVDASLQDLAVGELGKCESSIETTAGTTAGPAPTGIEKGEVSSGKDSAKVKVEGISTWGGEVNFYICGPIASGVCTSGGVKANGTSGNVGVKVSNAESMVESGTATLTSAGRYCWFAEFTPDTATAQKGVQGATDDGSGHTPNPECFEVAPVKPTLTTKASCTHSPCVLTVDTLEDTAKLEGTANAPGTNGSNSTYKSINATNGAPADSSISWTLYGPGGTPAGCANSKTLSPSTATVSGDGTYGPVKYKPTLSDGVGTYTFVASYGGESPNTEKATPTACPDTTKTEIITVIGKASSSSKQRWLPNDRVKLESTGGALNGTLTVTLYQGTFSGTAENCTAGTATAVSGQSYSFTVSGAASGSVFQTTNTDPATAPNSTFYVGTKPDGTAGGAAGSYFWLVHYKDNNLESPADRCETSTVSPITDSP